MQLDSDWCHHLGLVSYTPGQSFLLLLSLYPISIKKKSILIDISLCSSIYSFLNIHLVAILHLVKYQAWEKQSIDMPCPKDLTV